MNSQSKYETTRTVSPVPAAYASPQSAQFDPQRAFRSFILVPVSWTDEWLPSTNKKEWVVTKQNKNKVLKKFSCIFIYGSDLKS
jgi:hypothetical protein